MNMGEHLRTYCINPDNSFLRNCPAWYIIRFCARQCFFWMSVSYMLIWLLWNLQTGESGELPHFVPTVQPVSRSCQRMLLVRTCYQMGCCSPSWMCCFIRVIQCWSWSPASLLPAWTLHLSGSATATFRGYIETGYKHIFNLLGLFVIFFFFPFYEKQTNVTLRGYFSFLVFFPGDLRYIVIVIYFRTLFWYILWTMMCPFYNILKVRKKAPKMSKMFYRTIIGLTPSGVIVTAPKLIAFYNNMTWSVLFPLYHSNDVKYE